MQYKTIVSKERWSGSGFLLSLFFTFTPTVFAQTPLLCGVPVSGQLTSTVQGVPFTIAVNAGDILAIRSTNGNLELFDPAGKSVATAFVNSFNAPSFTVTAAVSGSYLLLISLNPSFGPSYTMNFQRLNRPCGTSLFSCGQQINGQVSSTVAMTPFTIAANAGDVLAIRSTNGNLELFDPAGKSVATAFVNSFNAPSFTVTAAVSGSYLLLLSENPSFGPSYTMNFQRLNRPCGTGLFSCGQQINGQVSSSVAMTPFTIAANAGDVLAIRSTNGNLEFFDPAGKSVATAFVNSFNAPSFTVTAAVSGSYLLLISENPSFGPSYMMSFQRLNRPCPVAQPVTVTPGTGTGSSQAFTFTFTDDSGITDIAGSQIVINSTTSGANGCYILFGRGSNAIALADDAGNPGPLTTLGAPTVLQNSQCSVLASLSSQSSSGNTVTLTIFVAFKPGFTGPKNVYVAFSTNGGISTGLQLVGTFTSTVNTQPISAVSVTPSSGLGQAQSFTFNYFDPDGFPDISGSQVLFSPTTSAVGVCYVLFGRGTNQIGLADDTGNNFTLAPLGAQTALQNSQCTVFAGNSSQSGSGTNLSLTLFVAFKPAFAGGKNVYSGITSNGGLRSVFAQLGTWTVAQSLPPLALNSVTPSAANGPSNPLTFVFSDPNGFADIGGAQVIVNPTQSTINSCYIQLAASSRLLTLVGDDGVSVSSATIGQPAALQNSQCIVNAASSSLFGSGNYLSLTLFITMKTAGGKNVYQNVSSINGASTGVTQVATWTASSPSGLTPVSVTPNTGAGPVGTPQFFTFTYSDPNGANDISGSQIILKPALQGVQACYLLYGRGTNLLAIASDDATTFTNGTLGTVGTLQNSQCSVDLSKSFQVQTGNTVNLTVAVNFKPGYQQLIYAFSNVVNNAGIGSNFPALGAFQVQ